MLLNKAILLYLPDLKSYSKLERGFYPSTYKLIKKFEMHSFWFLASFNWLPLVWRGRFLKHEEKVLEGYEIQKNN
jgi:CDP-glycerol glycerophosphotransferase (TagB/SpsB family)